MFGRRRRAGGGNGGSGGRIQAPGLNAEWRGSVAARNRRFRPAVCKPLRPLRRRPLGFRQADSTPVAAAQQQLAAPPGRREVTQSLTLAQ